MPTPVVSCIEKVMNTINRQKITLQCLGTIALRKRSKMRVMKILSRLALRYECANSLSSLHSVHYLWMSIYGFQWKQ